MLLELEFEFDLPSAEFDLPSAEFDLPSAEFDLPSAEFDLPSAGGTNNSAYKSGKKDNKSLKETIFSWYSI
jgi:hypothetical protein